MQLIAIALLVGVVAGHVVVRIVRLVRGPYNPVEDDGIPSKTGRGTQNLSKHAKRSSNSLTSNATGEATVEWKEIEMARRPRQAPADTEFELELGSQSIAPVRKKGRHTPSLD